MRAFLFNTVMASGIMAGRKRQTRRTHKKNKAKVGDIVWVREPASVIRVDPLFIEMDIKYKADGSVVRMDVPYRFWNHNNTSVARWIEFKQGIPNGCIVEAARTFLKVVEVRTEPLQDISDEDLLLEGLYVSNNPNGDELYSYDPRGLSSMWSNSKRRAFQLLWDSTSKDCLKWDDNPLVDVFTFDPVERPE